MTNDPQAKLREDRNFKFKAWFYNHHRTVFRCIFEQPLNLTTKAGWKFMADSLPEAVVLNEEIEEFDVLTTSHRDVWVMNARLDDGIQEDEAISKYEETFTAAPLWDWLEGIIDSDTAEVLRPAFEPA